jgi:hypothetical protein
LPWSLTKNQSKSAATTALVGLAAPLTFLGGFFCFTAAFFMAFGLESAGESGNNHFSLLKID